MSAQAAKTVVLTGATSGIGLALAERLCGQGHRVFGIGRKAAQLRALEAQFPGLFAGIEADLAEAGARGPAMAALSARCEAPDVIVNNAGAVLYETSLEVDLEAWRRLFEVNFWAAVELTRGLAARMRPGGLILNVTSAVARHLPGPKFAPYALTKVALEELTLALRLELAPRGVRVTSVAPGLVDTPIYESVEGFSRARTKLAEQVPCWLSPGDVADALAWIVQLPPNVGVGELTLLPMGQAR